MKRLVQVGVGCSIGKKPASGIVEEIQALVRIYLVHFREGTVQEIPGAGIVLLSAPECGDYHRTPQQYPVGIQLVG